VIQSFNAFYFSEHSKSNFAWLFNLIFCISLYTKKDKIYDSEKEKQFKKNKIGHLKIKNKKFEGVENLKYLEVVLNEDNNCQTDLQERIKNANKTYLMLQKFFKNKNIAKKLKLRLKNTTIDKMLT
jgi:hypothetical protein